MVLLFMIAHTHFTRRHGVYTTEALSYSKTQRTLRSSRRRVDSTLACVDSINRYLRQSNSPRCSGYTNKPRRVNSVVAAAIVFATNIAVIVSRRGDARPRQRSERRSPYSPWRAVRSWRDGCACLGLHPRSASFVLCVAAGVLDESLSLAHGICISLCDGAVSSVPISGFVPHVMQQS